MRVADIRIDKEYSYYSHGWLPLNEAADRYGWNRGTVRRWVKEGKLRKRGYAYRSIWIANIDIERYSEEVRRKSTLEQEVNRD